MKILVINAGSSSLKYQLFDMATETVMAKGVAERIGLADGAITQKYGDPARQKHEEKMEIKNHDAAIARVLQLLTDKELGVIADISEIAAVGHRFAHGGEIRESTILGEKEMDYLRSIVPINPLHGPGSIAGVDACRRAMPGVKHVGVFDTAFHATIPDYAYVYPLPYEWYEEHKVRRYGFHGTSHRYVAGKAAEMLGKKPEDTRVIVCHLGNGSSITAVKGGKSLDTTMGFTPLDGVPMGSRSGSIDASIVTYMMKTLGKTADEMDTILNKQSGLLGISGVSSDCYKVMINEDPKFDYRCKLAIDVLIHNIKKIIGSYIAEMNGADAIVFTAGIGENDKIIRQRVCEGMDYLGIEIDESVNGAMSRGADATDISAPDARVKVFMIPTNEEYMIALDTKNLVG